MSNEPSCRTTLEYSERWANEPIFSDFESRGFDIDNMQLRYPDRLARLLLVTAPALYNAVSTRRWDEVHHPTLTEKKI